MNPVDSPLLDVSLKGQELGTPIYLPREVEFSALKKKLCT